MKKLKLFFPGVALLASVGLSTGTVQAAPIVEWGFNLTNHWDEASTTWSSVGVNPASPFGSGATLPDGNTPGDAGSYSYIQWGSPTTPGGSRSFLGADGTISRTGLYTNDPLGVSGSNYYHGNYLQFPPSNTREKVLTGTKLVAEIDIFSVVPGGETIHINRTYTIKFTETFNEVPLEECPGYPWGGDGSGITTCPDRLTISIEDLKFSTGVIDGYIYDFVVSFDPTTFQNIAGITPNPDGTVSIWTNEQVLSVLGTRVTVTARVPEPAALALFGCGLIAGGLALRRRKAA